MSVKRYEWVACDEHACHCDVVESAEGDMVDYEDYAALEQKLADSQREFRAADATIENLQMQLEKLAAENAGLKAAINEHSEGFTVCPCCGTEHDSCHDDVCRALNETPATDAFLAEVRAHARNEGINYAAGRLAAAFNHGFIDKPITEVCDVVRMILDTKEELANSTLPAADGLSGEYADEFLEDSAAQISQEAAQ